MDVVYFSTKSENTHRFAGRLDLPASRISLRVEEPLIMRSPYALVVPTYAAPDGRGAVPKQVILFLNQEINRRWLRGIIASGNSNFGPTFGIAGDIISAKCNVPYLYRFELSGTNEDVINVRNRLERLDA